ncbi:DM13 domain-containing protein [Leptolyngbya sp. AN02str]|uniref:DM13 domain-containing protein n=1 Tax=Leptolyngbya sp. AN02str TaxID=3423363 RepID=UPI003D323489
MKRYVLFGVLSALMVACSGQGPSSAVPESSSSVAASPSIESSGAENSGTVAAAPTVLKSGMFTDGEHPTQGTAQIVTENGDRYLEFSSDFRTDSGPDLFVILHRNADVIGTTQPPAHAIQEGDYVTLAALQSTTGTQRYAIPADVNLDNYQSAAIWCRQFNATFGAASLQ